LYPIPTKSGGRRLAQTKKSEPWHLGARQNLEAPYCGGIHVYWLVAYAVLSPKTDGGMANESN